MEIIFKKLLPSPFTIAILLTFGVLIIGIISTEHNFLELLSFWEKGLWNVGLMNFAMQMMLMLVLGYVIALSEPFEKIIYNITKLCTNTSSAAFFVSLSTIIISLLNWGLGLIFGAILARKVGEHAKKNNININYPLIGACGYSGLMVWHGGFSGSIPLKISEYGHFTEIIKNEKILNLLPKDGINFDLTVMSNMNITVCILLIILVPSILYLIGKNSSKDKTVVLNIIKKTEKKRKKTNGAEQLDHSLIFGKFVGFIILFIAIRKGIIINSLSLINPNFINLTLLGFTLILHKNIFSFLKVVNHAISSASGILIQFPLYFGIMGIMNSSGLVDVFSNFFINIANENTFAIFTMISGGIVNIFVPSGGGQWAVQGPIILQSAVEIGVPIPKSIMALVYGDQLTNMLQPFWALPLLGITGLKAKELLPYTLLIMIIGLSVFVSCLLLF